MGPSSKSNAVITDLSGWMVLCQLMGSISDFYTGGGSCVVDGSRRFTGSSKRVYSDVRLQTLAINLCLVTILLRDGVAWLETICVSFCFRIRRARTHFCPIGIANILEYP